MFGIRSVQELLGSCGIQQNYVMPTATVLEYLSHITVFQGYGPWWVVALAFVCVLPKTLCGAAEVIKALADWRGRR